MGVFSAAGAGQGLGLRVYRAAKAGDREHALAMVRTYLADGGARDELFRDDRHGASAFGLWAKTASAELLAYLEKDGIPWTPYTALAWGRDDLAIRLCGEEPALLLREQGCGNPLHWALHDGRFEFVHWALGRVDVPASEGRTGYVRAATFGRLPASIRCAVDECGADVDYGERTALHHEANHGWPKLVPLLLELGADPNRPDGDGNTPLHLAAKRGTSGSLVETLLAAGADPARRNAAGERPLDLARRATKPHAAAALGG